MRLNCNCEKYKLFCCVVCFVAVRCFIYFLLFFLLLLLLRSFGSIKRKEISKAVDRKIKIMKLVNEIYTEKAFHFIQHKITDTHHIEYLFSFIFSLKYIAYILSLVMPFKRFRLAKPDFIILQRMEISAKNILLYYYFKPNVIFFPFEYLEFIASVYFPVIWSHSFLVSNIKLEKFFPNFEKILFK